MSTLPGTAGSHGHLHARWQGFIPAAPTFSTLSAARPPWGRHTGCTHTLRSSAPAALRGAALSPEPLVRGQAPLHRLPWPRTGLGQLGGINPPVRATRSEENESKPRGLEGAWPKELGVRNPCGQRLGVAELVLALGRSLVPPSPDQAWGTGCIYIFVGYFALIKAVPALTLPPRLLERAAGQRRSCSRRQGQH